MGIDFQFASAGRIVFSTGAAQRLSEHLPGALGGGLSGRRALVVTGSSEARAAVPLSALREARVATQVVCISGEPTLADAERSLEVGRTHEADFVVACGGGSAIDLAKVTSLLLANSGSALDYLEVIGHGKKPTHPALPTIALPTTSGTGAEVTKNGVLASEEHRVKVSLRHDSMLPELALVDPQLTLSVPPAVTAATGLDALTQCIEPYLSRMAQPLTDGIALQGIRAGARCLRAAVSEGTNIEAREGMALCSLFGGLSLANAKLGAVHGIAGPFGGMFESPHGAVCARLLPLVLRANLKALREREPESPIIRRFSDVAEALTGRPGASPEEGIEFVEELTVDLNIPRLASYGLTGAELESLVEKSERASSMKGNPLVLTRDELLRIVEQAS